MLSIRVEEQITDARIFLSQVYNPCISLGVDAEYSGCGVQIGGGKYVSRGIRHDPATKYVNAASRFEPTTWDVGLSRI